MRIVVFLDLDDTLFQTLPKCPPGEAVSPAARGRDGKPLSFLTERQRRLFDWLNASATVIPATARNHDAFRRVELPFHSLAILNFGGVILKADGSLDERWDAQVRPQLLAHGDELRRLHQHVEAFLQQHRLTARARLIVDFDLPLYVVIKHPAGDLSELRTIRQQHLQGLDTSRFFLHDNHNNLSIVPRCLGKDKAVRYLLEQHFAGEPVLTLGLGDSWTDLPFLRQCDFLLMPRQSQLAGCFPCEG